MIGGFLGSVLGSATSSISITAAVALFAGLIFLVATGAGLSQLAATLFLGIALGGWGGWQVQDWRHAKQAEQQAQRELAAERAARADEMVRTRNTERINDEQTQKEAQRQAVAAASRRAIAGLRNTIARLNARELPPDPRAAASALEARAARDLLGECGDKYRAVDERAQSLGDQVEGLQAFAIDVCKAGQGGQNAKPLAR